MKLAASNTAQTTGEGLTTPFHEVHTLCGEIYNLRSRIEHLAAHLVGSVPQATEGSGEKVADGVLHVMRHAVDVAQAEITAAHEALARIERMVL